MSLSTQVPGLSMYDHGARFAGAVTPIIRGINATGSPARGFRSFEQAPVGTYIGNSPVDGYFQLDDLNQIEICAGRKGPCTERAHSVVRCGLIPNSPELNKFDGLLEAGGSRVAHSDGTGYSLKSMFNVPLGDVLAFELPHDTTMIRAGSMLWNDHRTNNSVYGPRYSQTLMML